MTDCAWTNPDIEADGFITPLEQLSGSKAKPMAECVFPKCEECDQYHGHYCTVPIVVNKQMWLILDETIRSLNNEIRELWDEMFTEEIEVTVGQDGKLYRKSHAPCIVIRETP